MSLEQILKCSVICRLLHNYHLINSLHPGAVNLQLQRLNSDVYCPELTWATLWCNQAENAIHRRGLADQLLSIPSGASVWVCVDVCVCVSALNVGFSPSISLSLSLSMCSLHPVLYLSLCADSIQLYLSLGCADNASVVILL